VYVPDCSEPPEVLCGRGGPAVRLAARGLVVLVLRLISRSHSAGRTLNNRRHLHRLGWQLGRTFLGAEVSKARSAVNVLERLRGVDANRIGIFGYDQGGQIAFLAAALDPRFRAAVISNYFGGGVHPEWQPVDRLMFGKAHLFGESELVEVIGPRNLCVEAAPGVRWPADAGTRTEAERAEVGFTRRIDFGTVRRMAGQFRVELIASAESCSKRAIEFVASRLGIASALPSGRFERSRLGTTDSTPLRAELARFAEHETHISQLKFVTAFFF
jgi:pimeloyl-ACP methyl ester carboxylesterase